MRKNFVFYVCFCLFFSQGVFGIELDSNANNDTKINHETKEKSVTKIIKIEEKVKDINDCDTDDKKCTLKDTQNNADKTWKDTKDDIKSEKNITPQKDIKQVKKLPEPASKVLPEQKEIESQLSNTNKKPTSINTDIRINEALPNPNGTDSGNEFIELYNYSDDDILLEDWQLYDKTGIDKSSKRYIFDNVKIKSGDYLVLYNKKDFKFALNNTNEELYLATPDNIIIFQHTYQTSTSGLSWNYDKNTWYTENPTPKSKNMPNPLTKEYLYIFINELFPNPLGDESEDEFIELYNPNAEDVNLNHWTLRDANKSGKYMFESTAIKANSYLTVYRTDFKFALNNTTETLSLIAPNSKIFSTVSYTSTQEDLSYNKDTDWYWEDPSPNTKNTPNPLTKKYPPLLINELLPNPSDDESTSEFIEIYNPTNEIVKLKNWHIRDASKSGIYTFNAQEIDPKKYFVIYRKDFKFALNNTTETLSLIAPNSKIMSSVAYSETREEVSLNYDNDSWYFANPTPSTINEENPKTKQYLSLRLTELLPNPSDDENTSEFIEIYNPNKTAVNLKYWTLQDSSKTGSFTFSKNTIMQPHSYFVIYRKDFKFALNNSNETISIIAPSEKITDTATYTSSAKEDISYNFTNTTHTWRWSAHTTPGRQNIFNNLPTITKFDIDKKMYKNVYANFHIKASDSDGDTLKVRWDFGDGHKSYMWQTRHKYEKTGIYHGNVRIQDESEEIIANFTAVVKKYPKYDVVITKIVPNPAGKDSGIEYIEIKNKSNQKINLRNWSIATGSTKKTLTNHPINQKLIIRPNNAKIITKKYAAISLPNKTGIIEIRRPNGKVSDIRKYGDKSISIPDNAFYEEIDGIWQWFIPHDLEKIAQTNAIIMYALQNEKILSQQKLEQLIAFDAVYNTDHTDMITALKHETSFFTIIIENINNLIYKTIVYTYKIADTLKTKNTTSRISQIHHISYTKNPCDKPFIFRNNHTDMFKFCH